MTEPTTIIELETDRDRHDHERRVVTVHVNERPVRFEHHVATGLEVKEHAIAQGVPIQLDFILVEELEGGRTRGIGDHDRVHIGDRTRFLANDGDDNS